MLGILLPFYTSQALDTDLVDASDITVNILPENPQPYSETTLSLESFATDLNKARIDWKNGKNILLSGIGKTSYSFTTLGPDVGVGFVISIVPSGSATVITKRVTVSPKELDILWEAVDGYTPPFYRGKSFAPSEGTIRAIAMPNTALLGSTRGNVTYTWKNNASDSSNSSGYNKDSYTWENSNLNIEESITVSASSVDGQYNATKTIRIPISSPEILFYKKSPTEGVLYNKALVGETLITEDEATIVAEPYFLSVKGNEYNLAYQWQTNGNNIATPSTPNQLTVRPTSRGGYATISLIIENTALLFQKASAELKLIL
jgi:hypothetical protein